MTEIIPINIIERKPNSSHYRVVGKGVTVAFLSRLLNDPTWTVPRICDNFNLTPAEVHAAWAFYYAHQAEIDHLVEASATDHHAAAQADAARYARLKQRHATQSQHEESADTPPA